MPILNRSDLPDLARYPVSLRSAARALWGGGLAGDRSDPTHRSRIDRPGGGAPHPTGEGY